MAVYVEGLLVFVKRRESLQGVGSLQIDIEKGRSISLKAVAIKTMVRALLSIADDFFVTDL